MEASRLSADKKVEQLSDDEFHHVLKELTDHNLPDSEKCPLVQHLKAEDAKSKDNSPSESPHQTHHPIRASNRLSGKGRTRMHALSKDGEFQSNHQQQQYQANCHPKQVNYVEALQELTATTSSSFASNLCDDSQQRAQSGLMISAGGSSTSGSRKPNRANSFTMPSSASDNNSADPSGSSGNKILGHHYQQWSVPLTNGVLSGEPSHQDVTASSAVVGAAADELSLSQSCSPAPSLAALSSPSPASTSTTSAHTTDSHSAPPALDNSSQLNGDSHPKSDNFSSVHLNSIHSLVNSIGGDCEPTYQRVLVNKPSSPTFSVEEEDKMYVEMKNLQRKANIVEYRSDINKLDIRTRNDHSVDRVIEMPLLTASRPKEPQPYDPILGHVSHPSLFGINPSNINTHSTNNNVTNNVPTSVANSANNNNNNTNNNSNNPRMKKKKRKEEKITTMSHEVDGYIGYIKDISLLESMITGKNITANGNADANNNNKKNKNKVDKEGGKRKNQDKEKRGTNVDLDKVSGEEEKSGAHRNHNGKVPIGSLGSNSSSLSGDDISTAVSKAPNGVLPNATSPDLSSSNGTKSKKRKTKEKVRKAASTGGETDNAAKDGSTLKEGKQTSTEASTRGKSSTANHHHSSSDDFEDATDAEDEDEEDSTALFLRSKKSNSLQSSGKVPNDSVPNDSVTEELCTVSDSEMADREKDFVTPRNKHFKKKKMQVGRHQYGPMGGATSRSGDGHHQSQHSNSQNYYQSHYGKDAYSNKSSSQMSQNLGRGYESERECSTQTNSAISSSTFVCQSLSSSMLVIDDSKRQTSRPHRQQSQSHDNADMLVDTLSNSDNDLMFTLGPAPVALPPDNGPKMPSYADIAKSINMTVKAHSAPSTRLSQVSESEPCDEFPQLNTSGNSDQSANSVCEVTNSATTPKARDHVAQATMMATGTAANGSSSVTSPTVSTTTANLPPPQQPNDNQNDSNTAQDQVDAVPEDNSPLEHIPEADSISEEEEQVQLEMVDFDAHDSVSVDSKKSPSDPLSPGGRQSPPVVIFGNNNSAVELVFGDDSPNANTHTDQTNAGIVFGFFDDIQSEINKIQECDYLLDEASDTSNNNTGENIAKNDEPEENIYKFNLQKINDLQMCSNNNLEENFYKNAVHVNDLENHLRAIDSETQGESHSSEDNSYGVSCLSPANSTISSSPMYSVTTQEQQVPPKKPFVSCLAKYRSIRLKETVEPCIQNYPVVLALVSGQWNKCKDLPTI